MDSMDDEGPRDSVRARVCSRQRGPDVTNIHTSSYSVRPVNVTNVIETGAGATAAPNHDLDIGYGADSANI